GVDTVSLRMPVRFVRSPVRGGLVHDRIHRRGPARAKRRTGRFVFGGRARDVRWRRARTDTAGKPGTQPGSAQKNRAPTHGRVPHRVSMIPATVNILL